MGRIAMKCDKLGNILVELVSRIAEIERGEG